MVCFSHGVCLVDVRDLVGLVCFWVWTSFDVLGSEMSGIADQAQVERLREDHYIIETYGLADNEAMSEEYMNKDFTMMMKHK